MYFVLIAYIKSDLEKIESIRKKYDEQYSLIKPHITIVFPISSKSISEETLVDHVLDKIRNFNSFKVHLHGLVKSWDHFLFLTLKEGNDEIVKLHDRLYSGILEQFFRKDIEFIPHVGLGQFVDVSSKYNIADPKLLPLNATLYKQAFEEATNLGIDFSFNLDTLTFIKINDTFSQIESSQDFQLAR